MNRGSGSPNQRCNNAEPDSPAADPPAHCSPNWKTPMAKSKHPGLVKAAQKDIVEVTKDCDLESKALKSLSAACGELKKMCDSAPSALSTQAKYLQGVMANYLKKAQEISEGEKALDQAKGDKAGEATAQKKLDKLEKEADALRDQYNQGCEAIKAIAEAAKAMAATVTESAGELLVFSVNGR